MSTLKTSSRTKSLNFRKANFNMLIFQLQGIPQKAFVEGKDAFDCRELFNSVH